MTHQDMARLHRACFTIPRPWSEEEIAQTLSQPGSFACARPNGFLLGRATLDEAELLTLAVDPHFRRRGTARALVGAFLTKAQAKGATQAFLEVSAENTAAIALYHATGFTEAGRRPRYYAGKFDALILTQSLHNALD